VQTHQPKTHKLLIANHYANKVHSSKIIQ